MASSALGSVCLKMRSVKVKRLALAAVRADNPQLSPRARLRSSLRITAAAMRFECPPIDNPLGLNERTSEGAPRARLPLSTIIDLSGSTALVTGASQGIGAGIARPFIEPAARVVINHPDSAGGKIRDDAQSLVDELIGQRARSATAGSPTSATPPPCRR